MATDQQPIPLRPPRTRKRKKAEVSETAIAAPAQPKRVGWRARRKARRAGRPKVKKFRLLLVLLPLAALAVVSTIFGMMVSVAHELPQLEASAELREAKSSKLMANGDTPIATLTGNNNRIIVGEDQISPYIKNAVISIEDKRFYQHKGVDYRGITRAFWADLTRGGAVQGASTITQQFVKNALSAQANRSVFEKLREAALAYHLERRWSKQKILTQYLNTVYFGNGAYGVESAVRTYFGGPDRRYQQGDNLAKSATPAQAALLASIIASPSAYDPVTNASASYARRDLVLANMLHQGMISPAQYQESIHEAIPGTGDVNPPKPDSTQPYYSTWITQQLVDHWGAGTVFAGGMTVDTSLDLDFQKAAEQAIFGRLNGVGPSASLVMIDNQTGAVKAMVGGTDYATKPFNLATNGHRQPGSSIKPFILAEALRKGYSPNQVFTSRKKIFNVPNSKHEKFVVTNDNDAYSGVSTLAHALQTSDNSVFAELGLKVGTKKIAALAQKMGVRTPISTNPAMTLGGLKEGVTPLEMAYAYSTIANHGKRVYGSFGTTNRSPIGYDKVIVHGKTIENKRKTSEVLTPEVANTERGLMHNVVTAGTGKRANIPVWAAGKTGTTENNGDAWFIGFTDRYTVAVWVGYPDTLKPMKTEYHGAPVEGGTFPAEIWHDFMMSVLDINKGRGIDDVKRAQEQGYSAAPTTPTTPQGTVPGTPPGELGGNQTPVPATPDTGNTGNGQATPDTGNGTGGGTGGGNNTPQQTPTPTPTPTPGQQTPQNGTGAGGGATATPGAGQ
jgi:penicillin-binding protein 1A